MTVDNLFDVPEAATNLIALLADEGVAHFFINPGTDSAPIQEALAAARAAGTPSPRAVLCVHESVALAAAIGHHMASGRPQAVMVHVDAGTLNLGCQLHNAQRNGTPVVMFAGRTPYSSAPEVRGHRDAYIHWQQEQLDQPAVVRNYAKWHMEVPRGRELAPIVRRAFQVAQSSPSGPAYVMLPREALMEPGSRVLPRRLPPAIPPGPDPGALGRLAGILVAGQRVVIVACRTAAEPGAAVVLARIAELLGAPVIDQGDRANLPFGHPLHVVGDAGPLETADTVLLLDSEVPWVPAQLAPPADAHVVQIDADPVKAGMPLWSYPVEIALTADTRVTLVLLEQTLLRLATDELREKWSARRRAAESDVAQRRREAARRAASDRPADAPDTMLAALGAALPHDAVVVQEAVTNRPAVARQVQRPPGQFFDTGAPALGWALGGAFGVKLARPQAPVVAICGDGSFNFGVPTAALWSAHRHDAPFVTVVLNNHSYLASKLPVMELYRPGISMRENDFPETRLTPDTDYAALARACGGSGRSVTTPAEMREAIGWALAEADEGRCTVLDVQLPQP
ncbi:MULTISPECIES: thiamine pyrophosphate-requiring protein [Mycobacterium avium complex (MAC)]|uniref:thiamine pyrophosphate-requiring protein n=1 Tax=Mycobacterium avium complex (MAC) TaxID=120793 RepID=UPI001EEE826D|nr:thiamine pyrophosphate-requiring protein [Mycobacterium paraintracellulare]WVL46509.1 thiamine pyrophosphate-requiring protein [Mycobacterium paraintracellulare]